MTTKLLSEWLDPLTSYLPITELESRVSVVVSALPEAEQAVDLLPSYTIGNDGVSLSSLVLVTTNFVCEIRLSKKGADFDVAPLRSIRNYRVRTWRHEIKQGEEVAATFELAEVMWVHDFTSGFETALSYAGTAGERDEWLKRVFAVVPMSRMLEG